MLFNAVNENSNIIYIIYYIIYYGLLFFRRKLFIKFMTEHSSIIFT